MADGGSEGVGPAGMTAISAMRVENDGVSYFISRVKLGSRARQANLERRSVPPSFVQCVRLLVYATPRVTCLPGAHDLPVVRSFTYPMMVSMSYASVAVVGTGVTTTGQEQLNRCSEWGHAGGGGIGVPLAQTWGMSGEGARG